VRRSYLAGNTEADEYMQKIISSSQRMSRLINDLLNYSRLSGEGLYKLTDINVILDELLADLEILIAEKNATIKISKFPEMEVVPGQIRQLFQNILSNALKFSKKEVPPVITINVSCTAQQELEGPEADNGNFCRITITDNGIGFNEIYKEKIFTMFQRLHSKEAFEGTGIGLAIVKKIVEKHNGIITVSSREGEGTTFTLVLPIHQNKPVGAKELSAI
jgi:signal transduction histidine kinase